MKIQQLRFLCEIARRDLSVSAAAEALHTSQPGVSRQIKDLEEDAADAPEGHLRDRAAQRLDQLKTVQDALAR